MSPAGRYYDSRKEFFDGFDFYWRDPHSGSGGFGASGAQFLFLWSFWQVEHGNELTVDGLHKDFKKYDSGLSSGCDVLSQFIGGLVVIDPKTPELSQRLHWPFDDLSALVVPTGQKIETHDHLKTLTEDRFDDFEMVSEQVVQNIKGETQKAFLSGMTAFGELLSERKLVADHSVELLNTLKTLPGLRVAKACGALGADTLLFVVESSALMAALEEVKGLGLQCFVLTSNEREDFKLTREGFL
ncbi:MAG: hypothetical protein GW917_02500 [Bdellovibrionales bacterium]|nr:hypothetical protein [Bdellovibrionales bacterium]